MSKSGENTMNDEHKEYTAHNPQNGIPNLVVIWEGSGWYAGEEVYRGVWKMIRIECGYDGYRVSDMARALGLGTPRYYNSVDEILSGYQ